MRLIDRNQRQPLLGEHLGKSRYAQPLRRYKEELQATLQVIDAGLTRHRSLQSGVNPSHSQSKRCQLCCLIFHERNQGADDQRGPAACNRR